VHTAAAFGGPMFNTLKKGKKTMKKFFLCCSLASSADSMGFL
jgi:hypothetical protein